ncbi:MAG: DUF3598 family protein [Scytolyngbya sp. HA4215-MV1]|jgi:hypothetical protein|nr:DUF3598 family protein [Scytolyngbya sp. HA4215-MV1]
MLAQWDCLLKNLGEWHGSFSRLSPQGTLLEDTPTIVSFEGLNENQTIRQIVRHYHPSQNTPVDEKVLEYSSLGRGIMLFENGGFSQGSIQLAPYSEFGAELGLIEGDRRLRLVQLFNQDHQLNRITLIRERRSGTTAPERPPLQLEDLLGEWQGEATTLDTSWQDTSYPTTLKLYREGDRLVQSIAFTSRGQNQTLISSAQINGSQLWFDQGKVPVQVLLLADGATCTCPLQIQPGQAMFLEMGWLLQPTLRQRLIRSYNSRGEWVSLTLVTEQKVR